MIRTLLQVGALILAWCAGEALVRLTGLPFPGSIAGFAMLLLLLALGLVPPALLQPGANWLLARMLVFFVPALLSVLEYPELLGLLGLRILFVLVAGTAIVMAVTAGVVCLAQRRWGGKRADAN